MTKSLTGRDILKVLANLPLKELDKPFVIHLEEDRELYNINSIHDCVIWSGDRIEEDCEED